MNGQTKRLDARKTVITGGSDGIGLGIAQAFLAEGAEVWLIARDLSKLQRASQQLSVDGGQVRITAADLTRADELLAVTQEISATWDHVDVLVNNAGMARFAPLGEVSNDDLQSQIQLNLLAPFLLTQQLLPLLIAAAGNVINISSTSAHRLIPGRPASVYAMTKGGVNSLTKALALELGPKNVRVNAIAPGTVQTPLTQKMIASFTAERRAEYDAFVQQSFALGKLGEPADVAKLAVHLASDDAKWITGSVMIVDGGLSTN